MVIIIVNGQALVWSWTDGAKRARMPGLVEEFRRNPDAVFERLFREGQIELLETLIEKFL